MSASNIGVLLPVRLETRFVPRKGLTNWLLRVRVIPDAVSITSHDPIPSSAELDAVEAMWRAAGGGKLDSARGKIAWQALVVRVGVERAAWLARTFPPLRGSGGALVIARPTDTRTKMRQPQLASLPPTMELWMGRGGKAPQRAVVLKVLADQIELDFSDPDSPAQPWWSSFKEAMRVGLAAEVDLGPNLPIDIDVLYVIGIGAGDPGPLLAAHADSGKLGLVQPGSPTTSIDGKSATPLGCDADVWRGLVSIDGNAQPGTKAISAAITGATANVRAVPGGEADHRSLSRALMGTLWPALWGHSLANIWGYGHRVDELGLWAVENVFPEGPLSALRVGNQPYGLLPITSLHRWKFASGDPNIETELIPMIRDLRDQWARLAETGAQKAGRNPLDSLTHTPASTNYEWRWLMPIEIAHAVSFRFGDPTPASDLVSWWDRNAKNIPRLGIPFEPARRLTSIGWGHPLDMNLVPSGDGPGALDVGKSLRLLRDATLPELLDLTTSGTLGSRQLSWGSSLLTELARHSLIASAAVVARSAASQQRTLLEPLSASVDTPSELETWALKLRPADLTRKDDPAVSVHRNVLSGLEVLAQIGATELDRGLRAVLDTATHRIDPWVTAVAWRRLLSLAQAPRSLGVYGWVDAPRPRTSASTNRYLLAPSTGQAVVAAILRDRALRDPDADRWQMNLTSDAVRAALRLRNEVRRGSHPAEFLGRAVEEIVARPDLVGKLRVAFPRMERLSRSALAVRRVCDGVAVLAALISEPDRLTKVGLTPVHLEALRQLSVGVDALGDLHVADAAYSMIRNRPAAVSGTTEAAAGLGIPPPLDVVRTARSGRAVTSVVVIALPDIAVPVSPDPSPMVLADAAVATYLDSRSGDAGGPDWTWIKLDSNDAPIGTITLADVGLRPCDTIGLGRDNLTQAIRDISGVPNLQSVEIPGHIQVRALAAALAGAPALNDEVNGSSTDNEATISELRSRYLALQSAAQAAVASMTAAALSDRSQIGLRASLRTAARWGITPLTTTSNMATALESELGDRVRRASDVLSRRLGGLPDSAEVATFSLVRLAELIASLVAPEGACPVYARLTIASFQDIRAEPTTVLKPGENARLEPHWLEIVATVRPALARLEVAQLDERLRASGRPMAAWSSRPGDPWQTQSTLASNGLHRPSRLVAVFGPRGVLPARPTASSTGRVAVAILDHFGETIPDETHDSAVAFAHDLPSARAPQAILLAVPPVVGESLTAEVLVDIVAEARLLSRARAINPAELGPAVGSLHLAALGAAGRAGVNLERN